MALLAFSWTDEQETKLKDGSKVLGLTELTDLTSPLDEQCLKKMAELEGKQDIGRTKPYYIGLGNRFIQWKAANTGVYHRMLGGGSQGMQTLDSFFAPK